MRRIRGAGSRVASHCLLTAVTDRWALACTDPSITGSCRGNEELNRLKAEELREFIRAVQPGAVYIHHEDFGGYDGTQAVWRLRAPRCRRRWPNDDLSAPDGGAGGLA